MSLSEYSTIMKEAGMSTSSGGGGSAGAGGDAMKVEHIFVIGWKNEEWMNGIIQKVVHGCLVASKHLLDSLRILSYGGAAGVVLWGTAQVVKAIRSNDKSPQNQTRRDIDKKKERTN